MRERPILFSGPMVRAIGDGSKTQTRRVVKFDSGGYIVERGSKRRWHRDDPEAVAACPYGEPGDTLWVRESMRAYGDYIGYSADGELWDAGGLAWPSCIEKRKSIPSIHMPRWASRYTLEVVDRRVQRLQDISEEDARAEGCGLYVPGHGFVSKDEVAADPGLSNFLSARAGFESLWDSINGRKAPWERNDWVWAVTFRRVEP